MITVAIPARPGAGKLPVAGIGTRMPVLPPQGQDDNPTVIAPDPTVDSCSVGVSEPTAYVRTGIGLIEGCFIDFRGVQNVYPNLM